VIRLLVLALLITASVYGRSAAQASCEDVERFEGYRVEAVMAHDFRVARAAEAERRRAERAC
jgi:hypothetical protein